jgi:hypothetical protein
MRASYRLKATDADILPEDMRQRRPIDLPPRVPPEPVTEM